jgi:Cu/Ag efflux pump CusA
MDTAAVADGFCPLCLAAEIEQLRADKDVIRSQNAAYERGIDMLEIGIDLRDAEIDRLRVALREAEDRLATALSGGEICTGCLDVALTNIRAALEQKFP